MPLLTLRADQISGDEEVVEGWKAVLYGYPLVDNFGTFKWPRASDLEELIIGSRA